MWHCQFCLIGYTTCWTCRSCHAMSWNIANRKRLTWPQAIHRLSHTVTRHHWISAAMLHTSSASCIPRIRTLVSSSLLWVTVTEVLESIWSSDLLWFSYTLSRIPISFRFICFVICLVLYYLYWNRFKTRLFEGSLGASTLGFQRFSLLIQWMPGCWAKTSALSLHSSLRGPSSFLNAAQSRRCKIDKTKNNMMH